MLALVAALISLGAAEPVPLPANVCILKPEVGPKIVNYRGRPKPQEVTSYWTPSSADVLEAEKNLPGFLKASSPDHPHRPLNEFNRQYIGIISEGKRKLFINAFDNINGVSDNWKNEPVKVYDGGDDVWRVDYDLTTHTFQNLNFNGDA